MKKILLIQFRTDSTASHERKSFNNFSLKHSINIENISALDKRIDWTNPKKIICKYDSILLGGSGELCFSEKNKKNKEKFNLAFKNTDKLINLLIKKDFPTLGICFGHQLLGHHFGVLIHKDKSQAKSGSFSLSLTEDGKNDLIFKDIPETFIAQYGHKDCLKNIPDKAKLLATGGSKCKVSALKYKDNIYSVQFHPEMNKNDLIKKMNIYSDYIDDEYRFKKSLKNSPDSPKIIENFIKNII